MSKLIFDDIEVSKKEIYESKKTIKLSAVNVGKIDVTNKIKGNNETMSFKIEDDEVYLKYNETWNKIRELLNGVKLSSDPIYDGSYIKSKVKSFTEVIKTLFDGGEIPKKGLNILVWLVLILIVC